jgi:outer membrane protein assembly factor BamB
MRFLRLLIPVCAVCAVLSGGAGTAPAAVRAPRLVNVTVTPALFPAYSPAVHDYVIRCDPADPVDISTLPGAGTTTLIDGKARRTASVKLDEDQAVTVTDRAGTKTATYNIRCLPSDFPDWTVTGTGVPGEWTMATPSLSLGTATAHYVAIFDANGVPVWWYQTTRVPIDATLLPGPTIAFASFPASSQNYEIHRLDGTRVGTIVSPDGHIDDHELQRASNGDYVYLVYDPKQHVDLTPYGGPADATVLEGKIEEISPTGKLVWSWSTDGHVDLSESTRWLPTIIGTPVILTDGETTYDFFHANAVSLDQGTVLLSLRQTDGVYAIDKATGQILWKLGGTPTPESLTVVGDPDGDVPFGGQHDVRVLPDGTITVFDDGTFLGRPPRAVHYRIDTTAHTATWLGQITDPAIGTSLCCGSARMLANGDWEVSWGGDDVVGEYGPDGTPLFRMTFAGLFSYRAVPVSDSLLSGAQLRAGMDAMARSLTAG